jgi:fructose-bisphosphate aldolase class I
MQTNDVRTELGSTVTALMTPGKGLLAAHESNPSIAARFRTIILFDETLRQRADDGQLFGELLLAQGIAPGIEADRGTVTLAEAPDERITEGLNGLRA